MSGLFEGIGSAVGGVIGGGASGVVQGLPGGIAGGVAGGALGAATGAGVGAAAGAVTGGVTIPITEAGGIAGGALIGSAGGAAAGFAPGFSQGYGAGYGPGAAVGGGYGQALDQTWLGQKLTAMVKGHEQAGGATASADAAQCTGNCGPKEKCKELYAKISALTKDLSDRRGAMLSDVPRAEGGLGMYDLFLSNPFTKILDPRDPSKSLGNWKGHVDQIEQKQEALRKSIDQYQKEGCHPLPPGATTQLNLEPPTKPFRY